MSIRITVAEVRGHPNGDPYYVEWVAGTRGIPERKYFQTRQEAEGWANGYAQATRAYANLNVIVKM